MGFKINHEDVGSGGFQVLKAGEYEVFPTAFDIRYSQAGNEMAQFNYKVRDDYDQDGKGQEIRFDNFVNTDAALWRVNSASKAAGLEDGKEYESLAEWASDFKGSAVRVVVKIEEYTNNQGEKREKNTITAFKESEIGGSQAEPEPVEINDQDLPF